MLAGDTLYGTTYSGGSSNFGTVFKIKINGTGLTVLKSFLGGADGENPSGGLVLVGSLLYGTTKYGGFLNNGTIFQVGMDGSNYAVLKRFRGSDGANPVGTMVSSGTALYGTCNNGVVFSYYLPGNVPPQLSINPMTPSQGGGYLLSVAGFPGLTYNLQRATSVAGPWTTLASIFVGTNVLGTYQETNPPAGEAFYRTVYP